MKVKEALAAVTRRGFYDCGPHRGRGAGQKIQKRCRNLPGDLQKHLDETLRG